MRLSVILVHYHTPRLLRRAVEALEANRQAGGWETDYVVVDNGSTSEGRDLIAGLPVRRVTAGKNLGYAGGLNLGVLQTEGDVLVLMNPDVEVMPGCLDALLDALQHGAAAAGPRFYWDRNLRYLLPPTEQRKRWVELLRRMAVRQRGWAELGRDLWRKHARRHWLADAPIESAALSGALLAVRRDVWKRVGPFDEGYRLYFEETDWLLRLERAGLKSWYVPAARAVHLYNQSAAEEPSAADWFAESERRFAERNYGAWFAEVLTRLERTSPRRGVLAVGNPDRKRGGSTASGPYWVEISPNPLRFPAAAALHSTFPEPLAALPPDIAEFAASGRYHITITDRAGNETSCTECVHVRPVRSSDGEV